MIKKVLLIVCVIIVVLLFAFGGRMFWLGKKSASMTPQTLGLVDGHLRSCGSKPNCVASNAEKDSDFYVPPFQASNIESVWDDLNILLPEMGFEIANHAENYLHATATSKIFGFVDDMEFALQPDTGVIEIRSQSRVGYSDMGANKKRIENIRERLLP